MAPHRMQWILLPNWPMLLQLPSSVFVIVFIIIGYLCCWLLPLRGIPWYSYLVVFLRLFSLPPTNDISHFPSTSATLCQGNVIWTWLRGQNLKWTQFDMHVSNRAKVKIFAIRMLQPFEYPFATVSFECHAKSVQLNKFNYSVQLKLYVWNVDRIVGWRFSKV